MSRTQPKILLELVDKVNVPTHLKANEERKAQLTAQRDQLKQEKETKKLLDNTLLSESRKEQIIEKRKADVRRRFGLSMDDDIKI